MRSFFDEMQELRTDEEKEQLSIRPFMMETANRMMGLYNTNYEHWLILGLKDEEMPPWVERPEVATDSEPKQETSTEDLKGDPFWDILEDYCRRNKNRSRR